MNMKVYGFGIIGCGAISKIHGEAISQISNAKLIAVSDMREEAAKMRADEYGAAWYTDYEQMLARDDIDIVCICTPSGLRREIAITVANYKKHIIAEKPIEITTHRIDDILSACKKNNVQISGIFNLRYEDAYTVTKKAISADRFGKLFIGDIYIKWFREQKYYDSATWRGTWELDGGGALMNQSIHFIDLLQWFMGPVQDVYGICSTQCHERIEVEDAASAVVRFKSGAQGVIEGTTCAYPGINSRLEIHGERGTVLIEDNRIKLWAFNDKHPIDEEINLIYADINPGGISDATAIDSVLHKRQIEDILYCLSNDKKMAVSGDEARKAVEIIEAIYRSSKENRRITL